MIDVNKEHILTLSQLAKRLPRRRAGRPVHPATIHRWRFPGVRNIRLECVRVGGVWHTSLEAFQRWADRLTAAEHQGEAPAASAPPVEHRTPQDDAVERQLDNLGI